MQGREDSSNRDRPEATDADGAAADERRPLRLAADLLRVAAVIAVVMALVYYRFWLLGVSNVWRDDGLSQHFPTLYYLNVWLRGMIGSPGLGIPLWSWNLGYGADIISTLAFHGFTDPFTLLSLAFPMRALEYAYGATMLARVMAAGLLAWLYFRKMGAKALAGTAGALVYAFTTFTLFAGLRHPFFLTGVALLPAQLLGVEYALRDRRRAWLIASVFLAAAGNYYFFYMTTIVLVVYAVARFIELTPRGQRRDRLLPAAMRVAAPLAVGTLLAAPVLLPTLNGFLGSWRASGEHQLPVLYSAADYGAAFSAIVAPVTARYSIYLGFAVLSVMLVPVVFMRRGKNLALKVMLVAFPICLLVPAIGSVFNGFSFPNNRYVFAWGLFLGLATALILSDPSPLTRREVRASGLTALVLLVPVVALSLLAGWPSPHALAVPLVAGGLTWALLALETRGATARAGRLRDFALPAGEGRWRASALRWGVLAVLVANIAGNAGYLFAGADSVLPEYLKRGTVLERFETNVGSEAGGLLGGESGYRVENTKQVGYGDTLVQGYPGTAFYFSIMSRYLTEYQIAHALRSSGFSFRYDGSDDRAALTALTGVKYYLAEKGRAEFVPFGFERTVSFGDVAAYQNRYALPVGFVYDSVIPPAEFERLGPVQKQEALLQGGVVDGVQPAHIRSIVPSTSVVEAPYTVARTSGATFDAAAKTIVSTTATAWVEFAVEPVPGAELYVLLEGFDSVVGGRYLPERRIVTGYSAGGAEKDAVWFSATSPYYWGNRTQCVNLGYRPTGATRVRISPNGSGTLRFSRLRVLALPMADYPRRVAKLQAAAMRDISIGANRLAGRVFSAGEGLLFLSVPYSSGWRATVDGRPAQVLRANTGFMGIAVGPGEHVVELRYVTPWLAPGLALAALGSVLAIALARADRRARGPAAEAPANKSGIGG